MKKVFCIFLSVLVALTVSAQQPDSSSFAALGMKLGEYYDAMKYESLDVQKAECDFLIESTADTLLRQFIAQNIYDHFINSPIMGAEGVAVHVFDKWFADGTLAMSSQKAFQDAHIYATFNRRSLLGAKAPALSMESMDGSKLSLWGPGDEHNTFRILYFYDTQCSKCRLETLFLNTLFSSKDYPVEFYAIYAGDDRQAWESYVKEKFTSIDRIVHLWDPTLESDFQINYGVTQTPRLLLVDPQGIIIGRGLDAKALEAMLEDIFAQKQMEYGSRESEQLFDGIFAASSGRPSEAEVRGIADYIHDKTLSAGDVLMFKQLAGDYLYYLSTRTGEGIKEGMKYHIDKNILSQDKVWTSEDDTLKVVGFARMMSELLSKSMPGEHMPQVKIRAERYTWKGSKNVNVSLDKLRGKRKIIIFYTQGCEICAAEKKAALNILSVSKDKQAPKQDRKLAKGTHIYMLNMDYLFDNDPHSASRLMDEFDLSSLPYIIMSDADGLVLRRYMTLQ